MRLAAWIHANSEQIIEAWQQDAKQILRSGKLSLEERRDHAAAILERVAAEITQPQSAHERSARARGAGKKKPGRTGAQKHGVQRMMAGIGVLQMATEFRALRLSVTELWTRDAITGDKRDFDDLVRFNEAIDQALMESIESFAAEKEKQKRLLDTMLRSLPDPSYILDLSGRFIYANTATTDLYGIPLKELTGKTCAELDLPIQEDLERDMTRVIEEKIQVRGEMSLTDSSGDRRHFEYIYAPVLDARSRPEAIVCTVRDITERHVGETKAWHHANHDPLTGLPNRRLFRDRLKQHTRHARRTGASLALLFIDLDRFKDVNDRLGHNAGDLLLQQAAERITSCVRETDTVARLGGDEFTVILLDIDDREQTDKIARDITAVLKQPFHLAETTEDISASIGIARYPQDAGSFLQLLTRADQAMYAAKKSGRDQFAYFTPDAARAAPGGARLTRELRQALDHGEFQLHYQPIVELESGRIAKVEALLRWVHPSRGLLPAADFIELAEKSGLLGDIESWVLAQAMESARQWRGLIPGFQVMLNQSPVHFCQRTAEAAWGAGLADAAIEGSSLAIEVTEKIFAQDEASLARNLVLLAEAGITLALDDFGTGQSSLARLKQCNIGLLKIAPSFVHSHEVDQGGQQIAEATIAMAHGLGLKVIAEGVETREQKEWLHASGCDYAQGFWFSRPLPAPQMQAILAGSHPLGAFG